MKNGKQNQNNNHSFIISETVTLHEDLKGKIRKRQGVRPHSKFSYKEMSSGDKKYPKGVYQFISTDSHEDTFDQVVIDKKTGKVTHEEHVKLSDHK